MLKLPLLSWIGNAAAALCGNHGDVSAQAKRAGCSRQTVYDHADKVQQALEESRLPGLSRQQLLDEVALLRQENRQLWDWLQEALDLPAHKQRPFVVTASALGLSLTQTLALLAILVPTSRLPSRATLGRWVHQDARRAGRVLAILDKACRSLVLSLCLDEIFFHAKPVLMAVEPASMAWVLGQRAQDRSGDTWAKALAAWPELRDVAADGGTGIQRGLELLATQRQQAAQQSGAAPAKTLHTRLDVFHIQRDGTRALRQEWGRAEAAWDEAEKVDRAKTRFDRGGTDQRQFNKSKPKKAWARAVARFEEACQKERAWARAVAALQVFRLDGQLNDREWAERELRAASAELTGVGWAKVRRQLEDPRALTFLDRLHQGLAEAEPDGERRQALVELWRWRRESRLSGQEKGASALALVDELLMEVVKKGLGKGWEESYRRVSRVLKGVLRASSCVECVNSVVRMHQSRHKNLTQELLDLKRLFFNCRSFAEGKRKDRCPYELLGLNLPSIDPWTLLHLEPSLLEHLLSSSQLAA